MSLVTVDVHRLGAGRAEGEDWRWNARIRHRGREHAIRVDAIQAQFPAEPPLGWVEEELERILSALEPDADPLLAMKSRSPVTLRPADSI